MFECALLRDLCRCVRAGTARRWRVNERWRRRGRNLQFHASLGNRFTPGSVRIGPCYRGVNGKHLSMTIHQLFLVTALLIPSAADSGASIWAYVPAGRDAQFLGGIHIPELLSERIVEDLVRTEVVGRSAGNVFSFDIAAPANRCEGASERTYTGEPAVLLGALCLV